MAEDQTKKEQHLPPALSASISQTTSSPSTTSDPVVTNDSLSFETLSLHDQSTDPATMESLAKGDGFPEDDLFLNCCLLPEDAQAIQAALATGADSTVNKVLKRGNKRPVTAVFIHAGAGYHSSQNEHIHLQACSNAAQIAMRHLKAGKTAVEAVEAAVRILEDKEITNAGFGSNLTMDGTVECDATVVDHLGRSGACGAVPNIKNPISLAKLILDASSKPMSLRRVPPNMLVGVGARDFAHAHGMAVLDNRYLVSSNAKERFREWTEDVNKAEERDKNNKRRGSLGARSLTAEESKELVDQDFQHVSSQLGDHKMAILTGTWNEGQADSPSHKSPCDLGQDLMAPGGSPFFKSSNGSDMSTEAGPSRGVLDPLGSALHESALPVTKRPRISSFQSDEPVQFASAASPTVQATSLVSANHDSPVDCPIGDYSVSGASQGPKHPAGLLSTGSTKFTQAGNDRDNITDTVGAIAIDMFGNIAAASSSGGIGMKHRGRVGPAALAGVGTAVIPLDPDDEDGISVAAVASGTGEHMVPTMASHKCAERLYQNTRRGPRGLDVEEYDEEAIMNSFILDDFMAHPGVKNQPSTAAIGIMAVKKTNRAYYLYFSHNTDSFALATMSSKDREPLCVMSRLGQVKNAPAHGAMKVQID